MASGDPRRAALGGGLFMVGVLVDHMDGEFARLTGMTSRFGHYYDHVAAGLGYVSLFAGLGIGLRSSWLGSWAPVAGALAAGSIAVVFLIRVFLEETAGRAMVAQENWRGFEPEDRALPGRPRGLAGPPRAVPAGRRRRRADVPPVGALVLLRRTIRHRVLGEGGRQGGRLTRPGPRTRLDRAAGPR